jgi:hypothetical protein
MILTGFVIAGSLMGAGGILDGVLTERFAAGAALTCLMDGPGAILGAGASTSQSLSLSSTGGGTLDGIAFDRPMGRDDGVIALGGTVRTFGNSKPDASGFEISVIGTIE